MEFIGIVLTGTLMSAFLFASFWCGYFYAQKHSEKDGVTVTRENQEFIEEMQKWRNFSGR